MERGGLGYVSKVELTGLLEEEMEVVGVGGCNSRAEQAGKVEALVRWRAVVIRKG